VTAEDIVGSRRKLKCGIIGESGVRRRKGEREKEKKDQLRTYRKNGVNRVLA
jgi:hypothetical protein